MANYTNQVPAKLNEGDQLTFNPKGNGNYILPRGDYQITVASAHGGFGKGEGAYTASTGTAVEFNGGRGGAGISATFRIAFDKETDISVTTGEAGENRTSSGYYGYYGDGTYSHKNPPGGSGGAGLFKANGTVVAQVSGGDGGDGASIYVGQATFTGASWSRSVTGSHGSNGASGQVLVAPIGYTTATNYAAGFVTVKVISLNAPPSIPAPIEYGAPLSGRPLELNCATSIDPDPGDTVSYVWEYRTDTTGTWTQATITDVPKATVTVPKSGNTITYRVKAVDNHGAESEYATGGAKVIVYNFPPVISGIDEDRGNIHDPFDYDFTVDDPDVDDKLTVWVYLDDVSKLIFKEDDAVRNKTYTADLEEMWEYTSTGAHTLIIRAIDDKGGEAFRKIAFTRFSNELEVELMDPIETDELVSTLMPFINYAAEHDAELTILVKNDPTASEENVTKFNYAAELYEFVNEQKTVSPAKFYCYVSIKKGANKEEIVFYGASFVLNANGIEVAYAKGIRIAPHDIEEGGTLTASDDNVMKALNTISVASAANGITNGILDRYSSYADLIAAHPAGKEGDMYAVTNPDVSDPRDILYVWSPSQKKWLSIGPITGLAGASGKDGEPGKDGAPGKNGTNAEFKGYYDTLADLEAAHPLGEDGDFYMVGSDAQVYFWSSNTWDAGPVLKGDQGKQGKQGKQGERGDALSIVGQFDTATELETAFPTGDGANSYNVGTSDPYDVYMFNTIDSVWYNAGKLQGPTGATGPNGKDGAPGKDGAELHLLGTNGEVSIAANDWQSSGDIFVATVSDDVATDTMVPLVGPCDKTDLAAFQSMGASFSKCEKGKLIIYAANNPGADLIVLAKALEEAQ